MDVATATLSPGEHGDSATDLPSKRLTEANVLGPTNVVGSATLYIGAARGVGVTQAHNLLSRRWYILHYHRSTLLLPLGERLLLMMVEWKRGAK